LRSCLSFSQSRWRGLKSEQPARTGGDGISVLTAAGAARGLLPQAVQPALNSKQLRQINIMMPAKVCSSVPDSVHEMGDGERTAMGRLAGGIPAAAHPPSMSSRHPNGGPPYDVRAALRRRTARRERLLKLGMIVAALGALLCGAYRWLA
jgi:hypothetical protein